MEFAHYYRTEETVGTGNIVFRRYSSTPLEDNSRFIQYIEGSLEEITAEDWGNITAIPSYIIYRTVSTNDEKDALRIIEMPDTVTSIGTETFNFVSIEKIVFSANLQTIGEGVCNSTAEGAIMDFSRARQVPTIPVDENGYNASFEVNSITSIQVPSSLLSAWKAAAGWSSLASKIVSV